MPQETAGEIWEVIKSNIDGSGLDVQVAAYINELLIPLSEFCRERHIPTIVTARELGKVMETMFQDFLRGSVAEGGNREVAEAIIVLVKEQNHEEIERFVQEFEASRVTGEEMVKS